MNKHTPGPWRVESLDHNGPVHQILAKVGKYDATICLVEEYNEVPEPIDRKADAYLIAAAPDLFKALIGVVRVADRATVEFDAARAAIDKAKGIQ